MTDEELDALVKQAMDRAIERLQNLHSHAGRPAWDQVICEELSEPITTLRAQLAEANARADRAEAALAAQIEVDAEICTYIIKNYDCMKADKETYQPMWVQKVAKGMVSLAREDIRNQPHDRTALERMLAETREKALREAYDSLFKHPGFIHAISGQKFKAVKLEDAAEGILALIEKPITQGGKGE